MTFFFIRVLHFHSIIFNYWRCSSNKLYTRNFMKKINKCQYQIIILLFVFDDIMVMFSFSANIMVNQGFLSITSVHPRVSLDFLSTCGAFIMVSQSFLSTNLRFCRIFLSANLGATQYFIELSIIIAELRVTQDFLVTLVPISDYRS